MEKLPLLKVTSDPRFLTTEDNKPFFWLGDTAWELFHRLSREDSLVYLRDRSAKGFTVIQAVLLAEIDGLDSPNANGDKPLIGRDPTKPGESYFQHVDQVISMAEDLQLYMALLPTWGDKWNKAWGQGPEIFTPENARSYGEFLGRRYAGYSNVVWVLGGDRVPETESHYQIIRAMASGIKKHDPLHLMTYHPNGGRIASDYVGQEDWLDINMFQSRHQSGFKEYKFTQKALEARPERPVIDAEPGYENIPNLLNKWNLKRLDAEDVRRSAYWNMFAGAAGHTYGCNEVWQMHSPEHQGFFGAQLHWKEAMQLPGAAQMGHLRRLFEFLPWQNMRNEPKLLVRGVLSRFRHTLAMVSPDKDIILVYSPYGQAFRLKLSVMMEPALTAFWFDPASGQLKKQGEYSNGHTVKFTPGTKNAGKDHVLLVMGRQAAHHWLKKFQYQGEKVSDA